MALATETATVANNESSANSQDSAPEPVSSIPLLSWEPEVAHEIVSRLSQEEDKKKDITGKTYPPPFVVGLVGMPGSGKSVSAFLLANELEQRGIPCMIFPHDGYHYPMAYLRTLPDAESVIYRRGAPETFDAPALVRDLRRIRNDYNLKSATTATEELIIKVPGFDHHKGDPEPGKHVFDRTQQKVVICEGLYLLHDRDGWEDIQGMLDLSIFLDSDVDKCIERVKIRNQCIPGYTKEEIMVRAEKVDRVNAMTVLRSKVRADKVVPSAATSTSC